MSQECSPSDEQLVHINNLEITATELFIAVWKAVRSGALPDRGPIADSALRLRNALNPDWPRNPDWLPQELEHETKAGDPSPQA